MDIKRITIPLFFALMSLFPHASFAQRVAYAKMSPTVRQLSMQSRQASAKGGIPDTPSHVLTLMKVKGDISSMLSSYGCTTWATFDDILMVSIPVNNLVQVASQPRVVRIEAKSADRLLNDVTARQINVTQVHEGHLLPQAFTGKGVIMGIQDIGFDLTHPNFYSPDMQTYRIKSFWDMLSTDTIGSQLPVGRDYTDETSILAYAHSRDSQLTGHGTHTLGTAAGSGYGTRYSGMAYGSDICLVCNAISDNKELIADSDKEKYDGVSSILGFKYIFDYADAVGKPCVISFSEGSHADLYGDNMLYDEVLGKLVGPGRIIVASAGNTNQNATYIHKPRGNEVAGSFMEIWGNQLYLMAQSDRDFTARMVVYGSERDTISISSAWLCQQADSLACQTITVDGRDYRFDVGAYPSCYDPDRLVVEYSITGPDHIGMNSVCPFSIEFLGEDADIEAYSIVGALVTRSVNPSLSQGERSHDINYPASSPYVIAVGATAYTTGYINANGDAMHYDYGSGGVKADFSSVGPTLDGRIKPDVMAPGTNVTSSGNSYFFEQNPDSREWNDIVEQFSHNGRTYCWKADTGTSMSSPAVGGAIALWLEARPDLTREQIIDVLARTCTRPDESMEYPNNLYGYGQIDVYRGLLYLLGIDGIDDISDHQPDGVAFSMTGNKSFRIDFARPLSSDAQVKVYSTAGQLLHTAIVTAGMQTTHIALPQSVKGVVAVQVAGDSPATTGSTLMRF